MNTVFDNEQIFELAPIAMWVEDFSGVKALFDRWRAEGVTAVSSLETALEVATGVAAEEGAQEVMVIGGAEIYRQAMPLAERLYVTEVDAEVTGDAFFPALDNTWREASRDCYPASEKDEYNYCLVQYDRFK